MTISVAYQGERGAFSEAAAVRLLGRDIAPVPCTSFDDMFAAVDASEADCCMAPIENSLAGSIHRNYDLLLASRLTIGGETHLRIVHNLIATRDVPLASIRRVYSHPVALAQCTRFLRAQLYGVAPSDPLTFVGVGGVLIGVCVLASLIPAIRAARTDPLSALRQD